MPDQESIISLVPLPGGELDHYGVAGITIATSGTTTAPVPINHNPALAIGAKHFTVNAFYSY